MKLLEYEAKRLFAEAGIPTSQEGQVIRCPEEIPFRKLKFPITLKTQVLSGGRGKAGGIRFAEDVAQALEISKDLFDLPIKGEKPQSLLLEPKVDIAHEYYVSVTLDRERKCPIFIGSAEGGVEVESAESVSMVAIPGEYSPCYGRRLAYEMGLRGSDFRAVSGIADKLYRLFENFDLDLVEINPLIKLPDGSFWALDGKVTINDDALDRQPRFADMLHTHLGDHSPREQRAALAGLNFVELGEGNIGIVCNGAGLTMGTMDLVQHAGGRPANFLDVGGGASANKVGVALDLVASNPQVDTIFINILGGITDCAQVARPLVDFKKNNPNLRLVVRLLGNNYEQAQQMLRETGIEFPEELDEAVNAAVKVGVQ